MILSINSVSLDLTSKPRASGDDPVTMWFNYVTYE